MLNIRLLKDLGNLDMDQPTLVFSLFHLNRATEARPFLGKCQWCNQKGHSLRNCSVFKRLFPNASVPVPNQNMQVTHAQAHTMAPINASVPTTTNWLFDSGASFHATNDLNNLSIHAPYDGTGELVIGEGSCLQITHIGFALIHTSHITYLFPVTLYSYLVYALIITF